MNVNYSLISKLTGIEDKQILMFYVDSIIKKIEKIIGIEIEYGKITEIVKGIDKNIVYLNKRPLESILEVQYLDKNIDFTYNQGQNFVFLDRIICCNEFVKVTYTGGYKTLPNDIVMLICDLVKSEMMAQQNAGLSSYKIKDISYSFIDGLDRNKDFMDKISTIFKVY